MGRALALAGGPVVTLAQLLAFTGMQTGDRCFVSDVGVSGSEWVYGGSVWSPVAGWLTIASQAGNVSSPLATLTGVTSGIFALPGGNPTIPAYLLRQNSRIRAAGEVRHPGGVSTFNGRIRLGPAASASDSGFGFVAVPAANGARWFAEGSIGPGSTLNTCYYAPGVTGANTSIFSGGIDLTVPLYVTFQADTMTTSDSIALVSYCVEVKI